MRERAAALDGTVTIDRGAAGRGTVVTASLPRAFRETAKAAGGS
jgi:signal transduction histidine kinase